MKILSLIFLNFLPSRHEQKYKKEKKNGKYEMTLRKFNIQFGKVSFFLVRWISWIYCTLRNFLRWGGSNDLIFRRPQCLFTFSSNNNYVRKKFRNRN